MWEQPSNCEDFDEQLHHHTSKQAAHVLVSCLVSTDSNNVQTFDDLSIHKFFQMGKLPREIPVSALVEPPQWQSVGEEESWLNWCYILSEAGLGQKVRAVEQSRRCVLCTEPREPPPVDKEDRQYAVERILNQRTVGRKEEYLVRWKGYRPEHDEWVNKVDVEASLIEDYLKLQDD